MSRPEDKSVRGPRETSDAAELARQREAERRAASKPEPPPASADDDEEA